MEVILRIDVPKLGKAGEVVKVRDGFARNYLIPKGLAVPANQKTLKALENQRKIFLAKAERERKKIQTTAEKLKDLVLTIYRKTIEEDRIFGSVSLTDLLNLFKEKGIELDKKQILLEEPIKKLGTYEIPVKLASDLFVSVKLEVLEEK